MQGPTIWEVGRIFGVEIPQLKRKGLCPFREHKRGKTFYVFESKRGDTLWKCFSCDEPNVGGAVSLYARLANVSWGQAAKELRALGYDIGDRADWHKREPPRRAAMPVAGPPQKYIASLDLGLWRRWKGSGDGAVEKFAHSRGLDPAVLIAHDVVQVEPGAVGFGYRDPSTGCPCRVKVRVIDKKVFWVEPRGEGKDRALAPLYLANELNGANCVCIVEGEIDALTLKQAGWKNTVSLPDGADSASKVNLEPIVEYPVWILALDNDEAGIKAARVLTRRAWALGHSIVPIEWRKGEQSFKDANDAWQAGWRRAEFDELLTRQSTDVLGWELRP